MGVDVFIRNPKRVEHRLVSIITLCFTLLFVVEYIRHQLPIAYSPFIAGTFFSSIGILIPGLGFHFFVKFTKLDQSMPKWLYPYIFYVPVLLIILNVVNSESLIASHIFVELGIWKVPVYNTQYYFAMVASIVNNFLYLVPLFIAYKKTSARELRTIYVYLMYGVFISAIWFAVFGLINFGEYLPPYPYLYGGMIWCFFLRHTMDRYDFLTSADKRFEKLFQLHPLAIILTDLNGRIKEANPSAHHLFAELNLNQTKFAQFLFAQLQEKIAAKEPITHYEMTHDYQDSIKYFVIDADYVAVDFETHVMIIMRDFTTQKENQQEILFLAYHDALTRLPNRRYFIEQLELSLLEAERHSFKLAVILIDMDNFKTINDQYGHEAGDAIIRHASEIIRDCLNENSMAGRLGGDEFVIFLKEIRSISEVEHWIHQLIDLFQSRHFQVNDDKISIELSIGVSLYPEHGSNSQILLRIADHAMYAVKRAGRNHYKIATY